MKRERRQWWRRRSPTRGPRRRPAVSLIVCDARFKTLGITAVAVGSSIGVARARQSPFAHSVVALGKQSWPSTEIWQCPACDCFNPAEMLLCLCCEPYCLPQRPVDACAFTPIGRQAVAAGSMAIRRITRPKAVPPTPEGVPARIELFDTGAERAAPARSILFDTGAGRAVEVGEPQGSGEAAELALPTKPRRSPKRARPRKTWPSVIATR